MSAEQSPTMASLPTPHHRHPLPHLTADPLTETSPLVASRTPSPSEEEGGTKLHWMKKHLSRLLDSDDERPSDRMRKHKSLFTFACLLLVSLATAAYFNIQFNRQSRIVPVEQAQEHWLQLDGTRRLWYRTWGNEAGIPIVFVHGGPGNAIADYTGNSNRRFFQDRLHSFYVVEVDQRGTGKSQPSVRDDMKNMKYYRDVSIDQIVDDFERVRKHMGIHKWLVWGGSFGSTLSIHYGERHPNSCLALILRGIYLDTPEEVYAVYSRDSYLYNPKRLAEFDILYDYAAAYVQQKATFLAAAHVKRKTGADTLDPNDAQRLLHLYAEMISRGDPYAVWHWFVFENNLMEVDPQNLLDPNRIDDDFFGEAASVAYFETRLWLHGSFEVPSDLLEPTKVANLTMPIWVCQGQRDEVCPPQYAQRFVDAVQEEAGSQRVVSRFLNATHEDTDPVMEDCLLWSLREFLYDQQNKVVGSIDDISVRRRRRRHYKW